MTTVMKKIYFLGPKGSYSERVVKEAYSGAYEAVGCVTFSDIVENTLHEKGAMGVLPIENSITSNVHENMDYLFKENLVIVGEAYLKIRLNLVGFVGAELGEVRKVYSHIQALSQCKRYIQRHHFMIQETDSTAAARELILKVNDPRVAAIGSAELADHEALKILDEDIGDEKFNITRFLFVSTDQHEEFLGVRGKSSIVFTLPHQPGALANILAELGKAEFNLTKIESRPIPATSWEYQFWIDVENKTDGINEKVLSAVLKKNAHTYKIMGIYPAGEVYE